MPSHRTWLLLRGLGRETGHWAKFPDVLAKKFPSDEIKMLDLPGAGEFHDIRPPLSISGFVDFLREQLDKKPPQYPLHLVAISLGGMIALEWMRQYPTTLQAGILINASLGNLSPFYHRLRWQIYPSFFGNIILLREEEREKALLNILVNRKDQHDLLAKEWAQVNRDRPLKGQYFLQQLVAASHYRITEKVKVPTLLLVGLGDNLVSPKCSEDIHKEFGYPLVQHPWGGHDLTVDDGPWVAQEIKKWVNSL
ncbi:MAG: alpha/beta hydrolase [Bdellovibrionaceae bacterium]|nr:alpha/beta hydrolase [Pseudobdellovibrionaceae bacterium]